MIKDEFSSCFWGLMGGGVSQVLINFARGFKSSHQIMSPLEKVSVIEAMSAHGDTLLLNGS